MRLYHYLEARWALDNIRRRRLKSSRIDDMNDPYEWKCVFSDHKTSQRALLNTRREIVEKLSVTCFSRSWNNILMWSHYGDKHKGICLGFDIPDGMARDVKYVGELEILGDLNELPNDGKMRIINKLYEVKYKGWCYEDEVRVHGTLEERDEETEQYFVNFGEQLVLREVIAGARFPMSKAPIENALAGHSDDVKIVKLRPHPQRFEMIVDERGF